MREHTRTYMHYHLTLVRLSCTCERAFGKEAGLLDAGPVYQSAIGFGTSVAIELSQKLRFVAVHGPCALLFSEMKIPCDAYIEPQSVRGRQQQFSQLRPAVCKSTSVAVDRDEVRSIPRAAHA